MQPAQSAGNRATSIKRGKMRMVRFCTSFCSDWFSTLPEFFLSFIQLQIDANAKGLNYFPQIIENRSIIIDKKMIPHA